MDNLNGQPNFQQRLAHELSVSIHHVFQQMIQTLSGRAADLNSRIEQLGRDTRVAASDQQACVQSVDQLTKDVRGVKAVQTGLLQTQRELRSDLARVTEKVEALEKIPATKDDGVQALMAKQARAREAIASLQENVAGIFARMQTGEEQQQILAGELQALRNAHASIISQQSGVTYGPGGVLIVRPPPPGPAAVASDFYVGNREACAILPMRIGAADARARLPAVPGNPLRMANETAENKHAVLHSPGARIVIFAGESQPADARDAVAPLRSPINSQVFVPLARPGSFGRQDSVEPEHSVSASARSYVRKRALRSSAVGGSPDVDADPDAINTGHPDQKRKKTQAVVVDEPRDSPTDNLLNNLPLAVTAATTPSSARNPSQAPDTPTQDLQALHTRFKVRNNAPSGTQSEPQTNDSTGTAAPRQSARARQPNPRWEGYVGPKDEMWNAEPGSAGKEKKPAGVEKARRSTTRCADCIRRHAKCTHPAAEGEGVECCV